MRLHKRTIEQVERSIINALQNNGPTPLTTFELLQRAEICDHFHGTRTLSLDQIGRVARRMASEGKLRRDAFGRGMRSGSMYSLAT